MPLDERTPTFLPGRFALLFLLVDLCVGRFGSAAFLPWPANEPLRFFITTVRCTGTKCIGIAYQITRCGKISSQTVGQIFCLPSSETESTDYSLSVEVYHCPNCQHKFVRRRWFIKNLLLYQLGINNRYGRYIVVVWRKSEYKALSWRRPQQQQQIKKTVKYNRSSLLFSSDSLQISLQILFFSLLFFSFLFFSLVSGTVF